VNEGQLRPLRRAQAGYGAVSSEAKGAVTRGTQTLTSFLCRHSNDLLHGGCGHVAPPGCA
jgi:hypothetical protein